MKFKTPLVLITLLLSMAAPIEIFAETRYEQKLIVLQGEESRFMKGEKKPVFDFKKDEVLPYLLSRGWRIVSVHVNERSKEDNLYGYVVVEHKTSSNQSLKSGTPQSGAP